MPSDFAENVAARSSASRSGAPAPSTRSPCAGWLPVADGTPAHSIPTCFNPKSSRARTWKLKVSESSSTFWRGSPSAARLGASSGRADRVI